MKIEIDQWDANRSSSQTVDSEDVSAALTLLDKLDGQTHTLLTLSLPDRDLMVGGGAKEYVVVNQNHDGSSSSLKGFGDTDGEPKYLCVGGQIGDYPADIVVDKTLAAKAIRAAFHEDIDCTLVWIDDT